MRTTGMNTGPRFDTSIYTQTGATSRDFSSNVSLPPESNNLSLLLAQDKNVYLPQYGYAKFAHDLINPSMGIVPNGNMISSGINAWENEHLYGRVQQYQGQQAALNREQQLQMQQSSFQNQQQMQASSQAFQSGLAAQNFGYQRQLQQAQFGYGIQYQQNEFGQQRYMQSASQQFQQSQAFRNYGYQTQLQHQSILGAIANTATGGLFGAVTEGIHELGDYINQKSAQNFQREMNPVVFQQQQQLQSSQIKGNLEQTGIQALGNFAVTALTDVASAWMQHSDQEFQAAQQTRNFNNQIYAQGLGAQALKITD